MAKIVLSFASAVTIVSLVCHVTTQDTRNIRSQEQIDAVMFLSHYGYIRNSSKSSSLGGRVDSTAFAIAEFQRFVGLPMTGRLDPETVAKMQESRCGNPDVLTSSYSRRRKRYTLNGSKWLKNALTWRLTRGTERIPSDEVRRVLDRAFSIWAAKADLNFNEQRTSRADIELLFASGAHGDGTPFDGPGKVLAHAFSPRSGGDAHFDNDERWTTSTGRRNLLAVAVHEIGHSLGLGHSKIKDAIMYPYSRITNPATLRLHSDDINAIVGLYGSPKLTSTTESTSTTSSTTETSTTERATTFQPFSTNVPCFWWQACWTRSTNRPQPTVPWWQRSTLRWWERSFQPSWWERTIIPKVRTIPRREVVTTRYPVTHRSTTIFRRFVPQNTPQNTPTSSTETTSSSSTSTSTQSTTTTQTTSETTTRSTTSSTSSIPNARPVDSPACRMGAVDAVLSPGGSPYVYVFKGTQYVKLLNRRVLPGYPRDINLDFRGVSWGVDAAVSIRNRSGDIVIYLFKDWLTWKFDSNLNPLHNNYRPIWQQFQGLNAQRVDAAFQWGDERRTHMFLVKGDLYYKLNRDNQVLPRYPRSFSLWGIPSGIRKIDAAVTSVEDNYTYFFVGDKYYKYDTGLSKMSDALIGSEPYPRSTSKYWFGCEK